MTPASKALDQYFTPPQLAADLLAFVTIESPALIGDFAAGDGELLRAAVSRWPNANCIATDIDSDVISLLKKNHPDWNSGCCDFLTQESREANKALLDNKGAFDLITLNPPFSIKGKAFQSVKIGEHYARCSPALAFVTEAAKYLAEGGQIVAILPLGLVHSETNSKALGLLKKHHDFSVIKTYEKGGFLNCNPRTAIVRLSSIKNFNKISVVNNTPKIVNRKNNNIEISIGRGNMPNNTNLLTCTPKYNFIHTTNLKDNKIESVNKFADDSYKKFSGPGVIIPRVGRPTSKKIVLINKKETFVLSECLFIIECKTENESKVIYNHFLNNWQSFVDIYRGTCAAYISIKDLTSYLEYNQFKVLQKGYSVRNIIKNNRTLASDSKKIAHVQELAAA